MIHPRQNLGVTVVGSKCIEIVIEVDLLISDPKRYFFKRVKINVYISIYIIIINI